MRPTTDKLRSAIFSILGDFVTGATVLDAFAGSGAMGIEAFSRGAEYVAFIDIDTSALNENINLLPKGSYSANRGSFLNVSVKLGRKFDIIFIDPPYGEYDSCNVLDTVNSSGILNDEGIIIYEESCKMIFKPHDLFEIYDERRYGDNTIRFIKMIKR